MTVDSHTHPEEEDRSAGILLGLACGDALGRPVEFENQATIANRYGTLTEMVGNGTHRKPTGTVTDDTELAICIAHSLVTQEAFDPADVADRFLTWHNSEPFDAGLMTVDAMRQLQDEHDWQSAGAHVWTHRPEGQNAGNGSVMRCAPYALAFTNETETLLDVSRVSSRITHADPRCTYGCAILNRTLAGILREEDEPLAAALVAVGDDAPAELRTALEPLPWDVAPEDLQYNGYVISTLQSALYHGLTATKPETAIAEAVSMGDDADTVGAVTGAIVGARFGAEALPEKWLDALRVESAPHGRGSDKRAWVDDWLNESLAATLRRVTEDIISIRNHGDFTIAGDIGRSKEVQQDD